MKSLLLFIGINLFVVWISGCQSGIDYKLLETPTAVVKTVKPERREEFSLLSTSLQKTTLELRTKSRKISLGESVLTECDAVHSRLDPADQQALANVKSAFNKAHSLKTSDPLDAHITSIGETTDALKASGDAQRVVTALKSKGGDDNAHADALEATLQKFLMEEILSVRCSILKEMGVAAEKAKAAAIIAIGSTVKSTPADHAAEKMHALLDFLKTARQCTDIDVSMIFGYRQSLRSAHKTAKSFQTTPAAELTDEAAFRKAGVDVAGFLEDAVNNALPKLAVVEKALLQLNPPANPHLLDVLEPLPVGSPNSLDTARLPVEQIAEQFSKGKMAVSLLLPTERELPIYAEYFALEDEEAIIFDLLELSKKAQMLQLDAQKFVRWVAKIINREGKGKKDLPRVFLTNVGALDYDASISDKTTKERAMGLNINLLFSEVKHALLVLPIGIAQQHLLTNSEAVRATRIDVSPLNLAIAEMFLDNVVKEKKRRDDKIDWQLSPHMTMASIYRGFSPDRFTLGNLMEMLEHYWQQRVLVDREDFSTKEDHELAVDIATRTLAIKPELVEQSRVLHFSSLAIEDQLAKRKTTFTNPARQSPEMKAALDAQNSLAKIFDILDDKADRVDLDKKADKDAVDKAIADAIKDVPNKIEVANAIQDAVKDLPNKIELASAIANAVKDLPNRVEMATEIGKAVNTLNIGNYATKAELVTEVTKAINGLSISNYATRAELTAAMLNVVKTDAMDKAIDKAIKSVPDAAKIKSQIDAAIAAIDYSNYSTKAELQKAVKDAVDGLSISNYATRAELTAAMLNVVKTDAMDKAIDRAIKGVPDAAKIKSQIDAAIAAIDYSNYSTKAELQKAVKDAVDALNINDLAIKDALMKAVKDMATKSYVDGQIAMLTAKMKKLKDIDTMKAKFDQWIKDINDRLDDYFNNKIPSTIDDLRKKIDEAKQKFDDALNGVGGSKGIKAKLDDFEKGLKDNDAVVKESVKDINKLDVSAIAIFPLLAKILTVKHYLGTVFTKDEFEGLFKTLEIQAKEFGVTFLPDQRPSWAEPAVHP